jgi:hypothetical protein
VASRGLPIGINDRTVKDYHKLSRTLGFTFGDEITKMSSKKFYLDMEKGRMLQFRTQEI